MPYITQNRDLRHVMGFESKFLVREHAKRWLRHRHRSLHGAGSMSWGQNRVMQWNKRFIFASLGLFRFQVFVFMQFSQCFVTNEHAKNAETYLRQRITTNDQTRTTRPSTLTAFMSWRRLAKVTVELSPAVRRDWGTGWNPSKCWGFFSSIECTVAQKVQNDNKRDIARIDINLFYFERRLWSNSLPVGVRKRLGQFIMDASEGKIEPNTQTGWGFRFIPTDCVDGPPVPSAPGDHFDVPVVDVVRSGVSEGGEIVTSAWKFWSCLKCVENGRTLDLTNKSFSFSMRVERRGDRRILALPALVHRQFEMRLWFSELHAFSNPLQGQKNAPTPGRGCYDAHRSFYEPRTVANWQLQNKPWRCTSCKMKKYLRNIQSIRNYIFILIFTLFITLHYYVYFIYINQIKHTLRNIWRSIYRH